MRHGDCYLSRSNRKYLGSAWRGGVRPLMCAYAYHEEVEVIPPGSANTKWAKCDKPGKIERPEGQ